MREENERELQLIGIFPSKRGNLVFNLLDRTENLLELDIIIINLYT